MRGNRDAFAVLVDRTHPRLVGAAGLILRDRGWAEDAAQDALVRAWRDLPSLRDPDRFDAWLHRLLVHACQDQLRRHRHELTEVELIPERERAFASSSSPVEDRDEMERGLKRLTDQQRTVISLRYYLGLSDSEVAAATGLPIGTVKSRLSRSLEALRAALDAESRRATTPVDGARWVAHMGPELLPQGESVDRVGMVAGRAGIVAASTSLPVVASFSSDGVTWRAIEKGFPATFHFAGLWARVDGFAAVGAVYVDAGHQAGLALWSPDGESWSPAAGPLLTTSSAITLASSGPSWDASGLVIGRDGGIATGAEAGAPGGEFWWQSGDGQHWRLLNGFPPLGGWPPSGEGMLGQPNGSLASDGVRIVALRGGTQPRAWTSFDGLNWLTVAMSGEISMGQQPSQVTLFPGGVLVTEESGAWFGAAQGQ